MAGEPIFKIEKGIEIPDYAGRRRKYPWHTMEIGDSFFVPKSAAGAKVRGAAHAFGKLHDKKFISRPVKGGTRIWRTA